jgi:hypothetical protein
MQNAIHYDGTSEGEKGQGREKAEEGAVGVKAKGQKVFAATKGIFKPRAKRAVGRESTNRKL